jgi:hypothetical protein
MPSSPRRPTRTASSGGTRAVSTGLAKKTRTSGRSSRCRWSSRSPARCRFGTGRWSCWPRSRTSDGVSWPGSGARTSTWPHASVRAAMMYQHATRDRDRVIALALGTLSARPRISRIRSAQAARGDMTGHRYGTYVARARGHASVPVRRRGSRAALTCEGNKRAGDGNRTRMTSLEGWSSTIELRPQQPPNHRLTPVAYRLPRHRRDSRAPRDGPGGIVAVTGQRE